MENKPQETPATPQNTNAVSTEKPLKIPIMADLAAEGKSPEVLFWIGCAGSFDDRARRITKAFVKILNHVGVDFAILGQEEVCTGDPARRSGNELLFQMQAMMNIETLGAYGVKKIVTTCPHCFNTLKNEYPELGGHYEVVHHTVFLQQLIDDGLLKLNDATTFKGKKITYHDSCYIGRGNGIYEAPRSVLSALDAELVEMRRCASKGLCCGAGGAQMFKEEEDGDLRVNQERTKDIAETGAQIVAANCPFCTTMLIDGIKDLPTSENGKAPVQVRDLAELIAEAANIL